MDNYQHYLERKEAEHESLCKHCGCCCGIADKDPCEHLAFLKDGRSFCQIYPDRFGLRRSVSGREFNCVPIRQILHESWSGSFQCAYKQLIARV